MLLFPEFCIEKSAFIYISTFAPVRKILFQIKKKQEKEENMPQSFLSFQDETKKEGKSGKERKASLL